MGNVQIQDIKKIKKFNQKLKLSVSLQVGIHGPKWTKMIENQVTNSRMMMMCISLGMPQMDFNFWTGNSWQWLETMSSILLDMCRLPSFSALADRAIYLSYWNRHIDLLICTRLCSVFTWPGWMFNTQPGNTEDWKPFYML